MSFGALIKKNFSVDEFVVQIKFNVCLKPHSFLSIFRQI